MRRLSPITICLVGLAALIVTAAAYLVSRPPPAESVTAASPPEVPVEPPTPSVARIRAPFRALASRPRPQPFAAAAPLGPAATGGLVPDGGVAPLPVDGGGAVAKSALASMGRRRLMAVAGTLRILSQVDENLFGTLKLPESARAAIRRINQEHKSKAQEFLSSPDGGVAQLEAAEQARRAAIDTVLDADVAKDFHAGELAATHSLRRQARFGQPGATGGPGAPPPPDGGMPTVGVDQAGGQSATFSSPSPTTPPVVVAPVVVTPAPTPPTPSVPGQPATDGPPSGEPPLDPTPSANPVN